MTMRVTEKYYVVPVRKSKQGKKIAKVPHIPYIWYLLPNSCVNKYFKERTPPNGEISIHNGNEAMIDI